MTTYCTDINVHQWGGCFSAYLQVLRSHGLHHALRGGEFSTTTEAVSDYHRPKISKTLTEAHRNVLAPGTREEKDWGIIPCIHIQTLLCKYQEGPSTF